MITIYIPGKPVAKARARSTKNVHHYTPEKTRTYEGICRSLAMDAVGNRPPSQMPVRVDMVISMEVPSSWPRWKAKSALDGQTAPTTKPDADNVLKSLQDAFNGVVWVDDAQIVQCSIQKIYSDRPGVLVTVYFLDAMPCQVSANPDRSKTA